MVIFLRDINPDRANQAGIRYNRRVLCQPVPHILQEFCYESAQ